MFFLSPAVSADASGVTCVCARAGFLPQIILSAVSALVALRRIAGFLGNSEVGGDDAAFSTNAPPGTVSIKNASFVWDKDADRDVTLRDINLECAPGQLTMIVGAVGCGKSSLLATLFRQITTLEGSVAVGGKIAYVPQTAWIMNETVRENVLMGQPMDETRCASQPYLSDICTASAVCSFLRLRLRLT